VVTVVLCAAGAVALVVQDPMSALRYVWPLALLAVLAWALFWRPGLAVEPHGVTVVNPLRTSFVPWPAIQAVETRFALTLRTSQGAVQAWASPAPGRHRAFGLSAGDFDGVGASARDELGGVRLSDATSTPVGNLAQLIRGHWESLQAQGLFAAGEDPEAATVTWHVGTLVALIVTAAGTVLGLAL
jgi:hypothetical protein